MTMSIIDQQIEAHFGGDFGTVKKRTDQFLNEMVRFHRGHGKSEWLTGEGGRSEATRSAYCYIIEEGDVEEGLKAYSSYVNHEYINRERPASIDAPAFRDDDTPLARLLEADSLLGLPSSDGLRSSSSDNLELNDEEHELFSLLGDLGPGGKGRPKHREAAELLGWDLARVKRVYARVHGRRRYSEDADVRERRKANAARYRS